MRKRTMLAVIGAAALAFGAGAAAAGIDGTGYERISSVDFQGGNKLVADGERVAQLGTLTQRWSLDREGRIPVDVEVELPPTAPRDALPYDGKLRVMEHEGKLWTAEDDTRFSLVTSSQHSWMSLARSGPYLVCAGTEADESFYWSWPVFQVLESDGLGGLRTVAYTALDQVASGAPWVLAADRLGGLYFADLYGAYGARLEEDDSVTMVADLLSGYTRDLLASPQFDLLYSATGQDGLQVDRILEPGLTEMVDRDARGITLWDLDVWPDTTRGIDRVAAAADERLFVFEVNAEGEIARLVEEDVEGWTAKNRLCFLDSGTLLCASGAMTVSVRPAGDLSRARVFDIPQHLTQDDSVPEGRNALTVGTVPTYPLFTSIISQNLRSPSRAYFPTSSLVIPWTFSIEVYGDFVYARTSGNGDNHRIHIIERAAEPRLALVDSLEVAGTTEPNMIIAGRFLLCDHEVFDLADPRHPVLAAELSRRAFRLRARPHPIHPDAQLIASTSLEISDSRPDSLYLWRLSPSEGLVREWAATPTDLALLFIELDDERDLLYAGNPDYVGVYDVSDPAEARLLHYYWYWEVTGRWLDGFGAAGGMLHLADQNAGWGRIDRKLRPWWWNGETIVPVGPPLRHTLGAHEMYGEDGRLIFPYIAGVELGYTRPDPLGFDATCSGPPPFGPR